MSALIEDCQLREAVKAFLGEDCDFKLVPTDGGMNNVVLYVDAVATCERYVLRVYNNGNDSRRVLFEHEVLSQLQSHNFSFQIPLAIPNRKDGSPIVSLSNGVQASLFHLIPGSLPKLRMAEEIGRAAGQLIVAMAELNITNPPPNPPYYDLYKVHHAVTRELFFTELSSASFDVIRSSANIIGDEITKLEALIKELLALELPQQLIHGDLHYDNVLVDGDDVSGLLDFEFCARDWRAMELAICLSKYSGEPEPLEYFDAMSRGYFSTTARLTSSEAAALPDLIKLRILSNVVYFVGRAIAAEDTIDTIQKKIETYLVRIQWLERHRHEIVAILQRYNTATE